MSDERTTDPFAVLGEPLIEAIHDIDPVKMEAEIAQSQTTVRFDAIRIAIDRWVADQIEKGGQVPDFWDEFDTSTRLAEHLVQLGWKNP